MITNMSAPGQQLVRRVASHVTGRELIVRELEAEDAYVVVDLLQVYVSHVLRKSKFLRDRSPERHK